MVILQKMFPDRIPLPIKKKKQNQINVYSVYHQIGNFCFNSAEPDFIASSKERDGEFFVKLNVNIKLGQSVFALQKKNNTAMQLYFNVDKTFCSQLYFFYGIIMK